MLDHEIENLQPEKPRRPDRADRAERAAAIARTADLHREWIAAARTDVVEQGRRLAERAYEVRHCDPTCLWRTASEISDRQQLRAFTERLIGLMGGV